ncbi:hypothetical protein [Rubrivirga sp.]|uniref:hypothetical protein n=1 Tax=Rubrivirga sp. TaxID=1885344 RepID=UPI003C73C553
MLLSHLGAMAWFLALWPPLVFFAVIAAASALEARRGSRSGEEVGAAQARVPLLLAITLAVVGLSAVAVVVLEDEVRARLLNAVTAGSAESIVIGCLVGVAIAIAYFGGLDRVVQAAQARFGDYVPPGSTASLGAGGVAFFVANVVLAPLVEEV